MIGLSKAETYTTIGVLYIYEIYELRRAQAHTYDNAVS
jgi:hypothetical protein